MQCQPQIGAGGSSNIPDVIKSIHKMNPAWFEGVHPAITMDDKLIAFDDISSMSLERFNNKFNETNGKPEYRYVVLGVCTVDIKLRLMILTEEHDNTAMHRIVIRGTTHFRARRSEERHSGSITVSFTLRDMTNTGSD